MDNVKNDEYYVDKIITDIEFVLEHTDDILYDDLSKDEVLTDSVFFRLSQITENIGKLSDEYKNKHPKIPWALIRGTRNRIIHDYGGVNLKVIYDTVKNDLPFLLKELKK